MVRKKRRYTITDGIDKDTNLTLAQLLQLTDFTDDELFKVAGLKPGESVAFPFFRTVGENTPMVITREEEKNG